MTIPAGPSRAAYLRRLLLGAGLILALAGCTGGTGNPATSAARKGATATPTPAPSGTPRPEVLPVTEATALSIRTPAPFEKPRALFVVQRQGALWLVSLDHPDRDMRLTEPGVRAGYVGAVRSGATTDIYFATLEAPGPTGRVSLRRVTWPGGIPERLFGYQGEPVASLTSDGSLLAYADEAGVHVRSLDAGRDTIASPRRRCRPGIANCVDAQTPAWSEDGRFLAFRRPFQEDGAVRVLEPQGAPNAETNTKTWGTPQWSPTGTALCGLGPQTDGLENDVRIYNALNHTARPLAIVLPPSGAHVFAQGCGWSGSGSLAVGFLLRERTTGPGPGTYDSPLSGGGSFTQKPGVAVFDPTGGATALFMGATGTLWMPDSQRLVVQVESPGGGGRTHLLDMQGRLSPIDLPADRILAVLPE